MGSQGDDTQGGPLAGRRLSGRPRGKRACPWVGAGDSGELRGSSAGRSRKVCTANLASHGKRKGAGGTDLGLRERPEGPTGPEEDRRPTPRRPQGWSGQADWERPSCLRCHRPPWLVLRSALQKSDDTQARTRIRS